MKINFQTAALLLSATGLSLSTSNPLAAGDWVDQTISPVTNPIFFEDPHIHSEVRPIFLYHGIDDTFVTQGGNVRVYAVQLRYAINDRLALIATKDGYIDFNPKSVLPHTEGWADLAAGLKYAIVDDREHQFIVTPGFKFELPTGNRDVFQGNGKGEWDVFVSAEKGWDKFHTTGSIGLRVPNDMHEENMMSHYSLQLDYYTCRYFIPFVAGNAFTTLNASRGLALGGEGFDLINFGSSNAAGKTEAAVGVGFRSRLKEWVDLGFAYERGVTHPQRLFEDRFTMDLIFRF